MKSLVDVKMAQQGRQLGLEASFFYKKEKSMKNEKKNSKVFSSIGCYTPKTMQAQNIYESKALYLYNKFHELVFLL